VVSVLALLCGGLWLLRRKGWVNSVRRGARGEGPRLEVIDRLALTPNHSLHLVRLADRTLLIGLSPSGCNLLEAGNGATAHAPIQER